ncbi:hypothetical protein GGP41_004801 [Bipolaris sorokiniana]|uniref:Uncharacterized protein n=1 Tax=Cochliobolus sativus TaxID=45130 RepID=A0A8H5ZCD9_COCSA|nr:hypothetical protein GGP41_004801 [Bipolaris sorokiniana]
MPTRPFSPALGHRSLLACLLLAYRGMRVSIPGPHRDPSSAGTRLHPSISLPPLCHPSDPLGVSLSRTDMPTPSSLPSLSVAPSAPRARLILAYCSLFACLSLKHHTHLIITFSQAMPPSITTIELLCRLPLGPRRFPGYPG